jgi:3-hydroxyisobutyrate dehydrogenase-like beta-hydroxyacid dehydrogenase
MTVVGLMNPGEMGSRLGRVLVAQGLRVAWASEGRSDLTARRAAAAGLDDVGTVGKLSAVSEVVISVCPPHAAGDVAASVGGFSGLYLDANAVSPTTVRSFVSSLPDAEFVDGGIIGPPPSQPGTTRLYVSGPHAHRIESLFAGSLCEVIVVPGDVGAASAIKMAYAAWTKGTAALVLAIRSLARSADVETTLLAEWGRSLPELEGHSEQAARSAVSKGWRWVAEMEEIAGTFEQAGLPDGFHRAAAEIYRRVPTDHEISRPLEDVLAGLATHD